MIVEQAAYSQNEITALMDALNAMYTADERPEAFDNIDAFGEDTVNNGIVMWLAEYNEEEIARFRETVSDSPMIRFEKSEGRMIEYARLDETVRAAGAQAGGRIWHAGGIVLLVSLPGLAGLAGLAAFLLGRRKKRG
jgi:hypothetical protein